MITKLLIGYSVFSSLIVIVTHFCSANYNEQVLSRILGTMLLLILASMQLFHWAYLVEGNDWVQQSIYRVLLFSVAPVFYLYSAPLLRAKAGIETRDLMHLSPLVIAPFLPYAWALPLAFAIGAGYLVWLFTSVYGLRAQRRNFRIELAILGFVFFIAIVVTFMGMGLYWIGEQQFYTLYAAAIGCAFLSINLVLGLKPRLANDVVETARETYAVSTLANVDCEAIISRLESLMTEQHIYRESKLDLGQLAQKLGLSSHQLSELINSKLGKHFSRYLREYRVAAAKKMLLEESGVSVLSVGLSVGFTSQSNFYEAFRDITGMTPGKFRQIAKNQTPD